VLAAYQSRLPITLVFTTGPDSFQSLVASCTKSVATHCALGIGIDGPLLHAYDKGVVLEPRQDWFVGLKQTLVAEFQIMPDVSYGVGKALGHVGKKYDWWHVLRAGILRTLWPSLRSLGKDSRDRFACAQLILEIDPQGERIPEWRHLWRDAIAPSDLLECALWGPSFRRIA
jgi:hypothetical protein